MTLVRSYLLEKNIQRSVYKKGIVAAVGRRFTDLKILHREAQNNRKNTVSSK